MNILKYILFFLLSSINFLLYNQEVNIDSLRNILINSKSDSIKIITRISLGVQYMKISPNKALIHFEKALQLAKENKLIEYEAKAYKQLGNYYYFNGEYDLSNDMYCYAINKYKQIKNKNIKNIGISDCYNNIGLIYLNKSNYEKAFAFFQKSLYVKEQICDSIGISQCLSNIGIVHLENKNYNTAIEYFQKSVIIYKKINISNSSLSSAKSMCYINMGIAYLDQKKYELALEYFIIAQDFLLNINDKKSLSACYNNIGSTYMGMEKTHEAMDYFVKSLQIKEELGDNYGLAISLCGLSDLLISYANTIPHRKTKIDKYNIAIEFAERSLKISKKIGVKSIESMVYKTLANAWFGLEKYKKAFEYLKKYNDIKDSIYNQQNTKLSDVLETKCQNEKHKIIKKTEIEKNDIISKYKKILKYVIISCFLIIIYMLFVIIKLIKKKK